MKKTFCGSGIPSAPGAIMEDAERDMVCGTGGGGCEACDARDEREGCFRNRRLEGGDCTSES